VSLIQLADRCEAAIGPDRELDAEIVAALRMFPKNVGFVWKADLKANCPQVGAVECCTRLGTGGPWFKAKPVTASIEAALSLLVPATLWAIGSMEDGPFARLCWPQPDGGYGGGYIETAAATPALALCAAALRARAAEGMSAGTAETAQQAQGEARQPGAEGIRP